MQAHSCLTTGEHTCGAGESFAVLKQGSREEGDRLLRKAPSLSKQMSEVVPEGVRTATEKQIATCQQRAWRTAIQSTTPEEELAPR